MTVEFSQLLFSPIDVPSLRLSKKTGASVSVDMRQTPQWTIPSSFSPAGNNRSEALYIVEPILLFIFSAAYVATPRCRKDFFSLWTCVTPITFFLLFCWVSFWFCLFKYFNICFQPCLRLSIFPFDQSFCSYCFWLHQVIVAAWYLYLLPDRCDRSAGSRDDGECCVNAIIDSLLTALASSG